MKFTFGFNAAGGKRVPAALLYKTNHDKTNHAGPAGADGVPQAAPGGAGSRECETRGGACGFLTEESRKGDWWLGVAELNDGYAPVYWAKDFIHTKIEQDAQGCFVDYEGEGALPLTFVCDVPCEGSYRVRVSLAAPDDTQALLFLGRRCLAARADLKGGVSWSGSFLTHICPIIPRGYAQPMEDLTLDVTVVGAGVRLCEVEVTPWEGPVVYIAGDSTVTDQSADYPYLPGNSYCGWGQMLPAYVGKWLPVSNHAHSGLTTESFREEGHYGIVRERIQAGDFCLIQFGHNDQKLMHLMAEGGYRENLVRYISELLAKGAFPVLVTPLARNSWMGGSGAYNDLLADYARICLEIGAALRIPVLDLHAKSMAFVKAQGREAAKRYFFPSDYTHSNDYGAYLFAGFIYEELVEKRVLERAAWTGEDKPRVCDEACFEGIGAVPDLGGMPRWEPPQVPAKLTVPEEYAHMDNPADEHLFEELERPQEILNRAEALELVVTAMHFFSTNVYNDMFTDVIGHEIYAGTVECAWQNGLIPEELIDGNTLQPLREVDGNTFVRILLNAYGTRKDLPRGGSDLEIARALDILPDAFDACAPLTRRAAADMCRKLSI